MKLITKKLTLMGGIAVLLTALLLAGCSGNDPIPNLDPLSGMPASKLLILQTGSAKDGALSHTFVELYNGGTTEVDLNGYSIQYADSVKGAEEDGDWSKIDLSGTIPPRHSFLILNPELKADNKASRLGNITTTGDMETEELNFDNDGYKVVLLKTTTLLEASVQNPFNIDGNGTKVDGYIDMIGAQNNGTPRGYEKNYLHKMSKQQSARRVSIVDTDDNDADFKNVDYRAAFTGDDEHFGISVEEYMYPKNKAYGAWNPINGARATTAAPVINPYISNISPTSASEAVTVEASVNSTVVVNNRIQNAAPASVTIKYKVNNGAEQTVNMTKVENKGYYYNGVIPKQAEGATVSWTINATNSARQTTTTEAKTYTVPTTQPVTTPDEPTLLIFQVGASTDGNISHSFVELYNNGTADVNLSGYSLQYAAGWTSNTGNGAPNGNSTTDGDWNKIDLSGTIKAGHSFLILGDKGTMSGPALSIADNSGDINRSFVINNRCFKVALMSNTTLLTVQNPFNTDGNGTKAAGYVDMVGAVNTAGTDYIQGYETNAITDLNKQTGQRRKSLTDTDDNKADFARATYSGATSDEIELRRPKNIAYGKWNPITGVKE